MPAAVVVTVTGLPMGTPSAPMRWNRTSRHAPARPGRSDHLPRRWVLPRRPGPRADPREDRVVRVVRGRQRPDGPGHSVGGDGPERHVAHAVAANDEPAQASVTRSARAAEETSRSAGGARVPSARTGQRAPHRAAVEPRDTELGAGPRESRGERLSGRGDRRRRTARQTHVLVHEEHHHVGRRARPGEHPADVVREEGRRPGRRAGRESIRANTMSGGVGARHAPVVDHSVPVLVETVADLDLLHARPRVRGSRVGAGAVGRRAIAGSAVQESAVRDGRAIHAPDVGVAEPTGRAGSLGEGLHAGAGAADRRRAVGRRGAVGVDRACGRARLGAVLGARGIAAHPSAHARGEPRVTLGERALDTPAVARQRHGDPDAAADVDPHWARDHLRAFEGCGHAELRLTPQPARVRDSQALEGSVAGEDDAPLHALFPLCHERHRELVELLAGHEIGAHVDHEPARVVAAAGDEQPRERMSCHDRLGYRKTRGAHGVGEASCEGAQRTNRRARRRGGASRASASCTSRISVSVKPASRALVTCSATVWW